MLYHQMPLVHETPTSAALSLTRGPASGGTNLKIYGVGFRNTSNLCVRFTEEKQDKNKKYGQCPSALKAGLQTLASTNRNHYSIHMHLNHQETYSHGLAKLHDLA